MKYIATPRNLLGLILFVGATFIFSNCSKDPASPGSPTLVTSASTVDVGEEVTLTMQNADVYTCLSWFKKSGVEYSIVSGGTTSDDTMTVKFASSGTCTIQLAVKNCQDQCTGKCTDVVTETTITIF